jgi:hypothetical protein
VPLDDVAFNPKHGVDSVVDCEKKIYTPEFKTRQDKVSVISI